MEVHSLTKYYKGIADVITSPVEIYNTHTGKKVSTEGIWDTGANGSVITKSLAKKLGLFPVDHARVHGVHGYKDGINVYGIKAVLNKQDVSFILRVTECDQLTDDDSSMFLIGMDVISKGDFAISNFQGQTIMTFRIPSMESFDFSKDNNTNLSSG